MNADDTHENLLIWWSGDRKTRKTYRGSTRMVADQNKSKTHHGLTRMGRMKGSGHQKTTTYRGDAEDQRVLPWSEDQNLWTNTPKTIP